MLIETSLNHVQVSSLSIPQVFQSIETRNLVSSEHLNHLISIENTDSRLIYSMTLNSAYSFNNYDDEQEDEDEEYEEEFEESNYDDFEESNYDEFDEDDNDNRFEDGNYEGRFEDGFDDYYNEDDEDNDYL